MTKVVARAKVEDVERWKNGFATHSELFKKQFLRLCLLLN